MMLVEKRDGEVVEFNSQKIIEAINKAIIATGKPHPPFDHIITNIETEINDRFVGITPNVENIHDIVEKHLMKNDLYEVAKSYIIHRAEKRRQDLEERKKSSFLKKLTILKQNGTKVLFSPKKFKTTIERNATNLSDINVNLIFDEAIKNIYDGMKSSEVEKALILAATSFIELEPNYSYLAAKFFLQKIRKEIFTESISSNSKEFDSLYKDSFVNSVKIAVKQEILDKRMLEFDLKKLAEHLVPERDFLLKYIGIQTLHERYFVKFNNNCLELPQMFWMRVAMGLSLNEKEKEKSAIEFYEIMSQLLYLPSTPTLFHSGLRHPQLCSCFLNTVNDDLNHIFQVHSDNAQMSKWSGGIGTDWTNVRATGALIKSTRVESQGVIPFLKIANDITVAINRSGKRRGAAAVYLEIWHLDVEDFIDLRKNTGDERRRTHDLHTALWIPDLFMKRVLEKGKWILFSPEEVPELHEIFGKEFEKKYEEYEQKLTKIKKYKVMEAEKLWRKVINSVFETGSPFNCFKDAANIRSPQTHTGVVHSSNLCCVAGDQRVPTNFGLLTVKELYDLHKAMQIVSKDKIEDASEMVLPRPNAPMVKICTKEGYTHKVTPDHKVWVEDFGYKEAQDLKVGDKLAIQKISGIWGGNDDKNKAFLAGLTLENTEFAKIPDFVWELNEESISVFLRGIYLINRNVKYTLSFKSSKVLEDLQLIWANFGCKTLLNENFLIHTDASNPIVEKVLKLNNIEPTNEPQQLFCTFDHSETLANEDAYCLNVNNDNHLWVCNGILTKNTEIIECTTYTTKDKVGETACCDLGSLNLSRFVTNKKIDKKRLAQIINIAIRMLDNVIDINYYPVKEAENSNFKHRPLGLGSMGWQDLFYQLNINFEDAQEITDELQEFISFNAINASCELAKERGSYSTFKGSKWEKGLFPLDTLDILEKERGIKIEVDRKVRLNWDELKKKVKENGLRNSLVIAIAPTATIANIAGCFPCIEPIYKNIYVKSNMSGEFTIINEYLVSDLKKLNLWNKDMLDKIKYHDGNIQLIEEIPNELKEKYKEAFDIDPMKSIELTALRGKWIDQSQSYNVFVKGNSGKLISDIYMYCWKKGLKTIYYTRTLGASQIEKATLGNEYGLTQKRSCKIDDSSCESCQ